MAHPRQIDSITVEDLTAHRWCYFHDDQDGFDAFEHVIPDTHPKFDENIMELELAEFSFVGGCVRFGMFDGSKCFSVCLNGEWFPLWTGGSKPSAAQISDFRNALDAESLELPVTARAHWSGVSVTYCGVRYYNNNLEEVEADV